MEVKSCRMLGNMTRQGKFLQIFLLLICNKLVLDQALKDKVVIARCLVQYWQIFSSFLIFCYYFTRLKAREISYKI